MRLDFGINGQRRMAGLGALELAGGAFNANTARSDNLKSPV
jgi:hypothetical protein